MKLSWRKYHYIFNEPGGTSRGVLNTKTSYHITLEQKSLKGFGECSLIQNLSPDDTFEIEQLLAQWALEGFSEQTLIPNTLPALQFGMEMALLSLKSTDNFSLFGENNFSNGLQGIAINGLIWMGDKTTMLKRIQEKLKSGFSCLKLKVGAINFQDELDLLANIRKEFTPQELEIRVDANGAFTPKNAEEKLTALAKYSIHSIEQPIKALQWQVMHQLCQKAIIPIALDEELISQQGHEQKLLTAIKPQYIILKPSLLGGFKTSEKWIEEAESQNVKWWATSALEGNVGLNAIAQWTYHKNVNIPQGLGTGGVFSNNIPSPLQVSKGSLFYGNENKWDLSTFL